MRLGHNVGHGSDVGRVRPFNEDFHRVWKFPLDVGELTLLAVADGMGGAAAGEVASKLATEVLDESFSRYSEEIRAHRPVVGIGSLIDKAMRLANRRVYAAATKTLNRRGMGSTLTCVAIVGRKAYLGHVGDSRAFLVRGSKIYQLTKDHSWVEEQVEKGLLDEAEAEEHEWRNLITRVLGTRPQVAPDVIELEVQPGDVLVLSTDGLHGQVKPEEILAEIQSNSDRQMNVEVLIALANERGGPDNITLVIFGVEP
ncbi:MAG: Stp1/IreP family PP2C-type Ser/Thr phosphatase [Truepera sp.]|nr:Stp1/IreP family PP2C-type Ser/Thr phosphatase [Truepera sp.]HRN17590.1 Stp1/IreP family PP2C-type Ser/Thr phosphatase [Trueperaceae bacterium]HRQ09994.1 Stp1/IreP family PP2C-type Ser/Thr phosphatase [Trueperaceae bacterium]